MGARKKATKKRGRKPLPEGEVKERVTIALAPDFVDEVRDAVSYHGGAPEHLTISGLVERAVRKELDALKRRHHGGKPFPHRRQPVRTGRPPK